MSAGQPRECPFCGAGDVAVWTRDSYDRRIGASEERTTVYCRNCGCRTTAHRSRGDALKAWNSRAGEAPRPLTFWQRACLFCRFLWGSLWD